MATTADNVGRLLGELAEAQKETGQRLQESDHQGFWGLAQSGDSMVILNDENFVPRSW